MSLPVAQLFLEQAEARPEAEAVRSMSGSWTYARIAELSKAIALYLIECGLEQGDRVATVLSNGPEYVSIYFGVHFAGGAIVPLNVLDKARTLVRQAEHCGAKFVFVDSNRADVLEYRNPKQSDFVSVPTGANESSIDESPVWSALLVSRAAPLEKVFPTLDPRGLATILYTSGTTDHPKGVMLSHANLSANMQSIRAFLPIRGDDRCLVVLPFYHSFGNSVLTTHLCSGAALILQENIAFPKLVLERVENERISALYGVPLSFSMLFGKKVPEGVSTKSLRYLAQAGGRMRKAQIQELRRILPDIDLYVMYGQTEATARISYVPPDRLEEKLGSAGKAVPGVEIAIRDVDGNVLPAGETGDICVRGASVMLGYWDNPEASSSVLIDGWLWTRDHGYLDEDGYLYIEGRSSEMIKTGANRVSPDEVEEVIAKCRGVEEVAVAAVPDKILGQAILAMVVPRKDLDVSEKQIKAFCLGRLAPYKIPKHVSFVTKIPRTSTGKIHRQSVTQLAIGEERDQ